MITKIKLKKLDDVEKIKNKSLVVLGGSIKHMDELLRVYRDFLSYIKVIVSLNTNRPEKLVCRGRDISVIGFDDLRDRLNKTTNNCIFLILDDYHMELFEALSKISGFDDPTTEVFWYPDKETKIELAYREKYKEKPLQNILVFRSGPHSDSYIHGMDYADNARVLFEYLLQKGYNKKYKLVWIVKDPEEYKSGFKDRKNVFFISWDWAVAEDSKHRDSYYKVLCLARYFFFTDAYGFVRNARSDQIRVQLWHGFGFKTRTNFVRCEKRYDLHTCISKFYGDMHAKDFGLRENQILLTGQPKNDLLFQMPNREKIESLNIHRAKKYILWLPTFRKTVGRLADELDENLLETETGLQVINTFEKLKRLEQLLEEKEVSLVIKLHPFQNLAQINTFSSQRIKLLTNEDLIQRNIQINEIMSYFDALISDYSSAAVDYLLLDRPIGFTLDDLDDYTKGKRGFHFDNLQEYLPGSEIYTENDFMDFIEQIVDNKDLLAEKRKEIRRLMHDFYDGNSCQRIKEALKL